MNNEKAFESVKQNDSCGKYVAICNGEVLAHFNDMITAILYTRNEIKLRKFAIDIFTRR